MATERMTIEQSVKDVAERAFWSFAQPFAVILYSTGSAGLVHHQAWERAALVGGWSALVSLLTATLAALAQWHPSGTMAVVDRTVRTLLAVFLGSLATSHISEFGAKGAGAALGVAAGAAFLAALKSLIGNADPMTIGDTTAVRAPHAAG